MRVVVVDVVTVELYQKSAFLECPAMMGTDATACELREEFHKNKLIRSASD